MLQLSHRPSDYVYALLAQQVYELEGGQSLPREWSALTINDQTKKDGYFGVAYQHTKTKQIIIAHRGIEITRNNSAMTQKNWLQRISAKFSELSNSVKDVTTYIDGIVHCTVASQQVSALMFALEIREKYSDYTISFAGHSFGGWLAQLCTYHFMVKNEYTWCVTLDSPGARDIIYEIHDRYLDSIPADQLGTFLERLDITNYLSSPNLINSCNRHLGSVYRLYPFFPQQASNWYEKTADKLLYSFHSHQVKTLVEEFDPSTGFAKTVSRVSSWPCITWPDSAKFDMKGPIESVVSQVNDASPIKIPEFILSNITKIFDAGLHKLINSTSLTSGFYKISQVIRDYAAGQIEKKEYDGFFKFANSRNQYDSNQDIDFRQEYELNHKYHYAVQPYNPYYLHLRHMNADLRGFLWAYAQLNKDNSLAKQNNTIPKDVWDDLNDYELIQGTLIQKKGWALKLKSERNTAYAWLNRVSAHLEQYPVLLTNLNQSVREQAARLYQIDITVNSLESSVSSLSAQNEMVNQRLDTLEQAHRNHDVYAVDKQNLAVKARNILISSYSAKNTIEGLFGKPVPLDQLPINVQLLCQGQREDKAEKQAEDEANYNSNNKKQEKDILENTHDDHISYEELFTQKIALPFEKLFFPSKEILGAKQKTNESDLDTRPRFLLIQGRAGIGKTTMVEYIAHQWSKGQLWSEFTWIFSLRLRDLHRKETTQTNKNNETWSLEKWIYHTHFSEMNALDFNVLWNSEIEPNLEKSVLFILDGYDEVPQDHPYKASLEKLINNPRFFKIITSRPFGTTNLPKQRRDLEAIGFIDQNIEDYVKNYFTSLPDKITKVVTELRKNTVLWTSAHIPVILNILCGVLEKKESLKNVFENLNSMSTLYQEMELALFERAYRKTPGKEQNHADQLMGLDDESKKILFEKSYSTLIKCLNRIAFEAFKKEGALISRTLINKALRESGIDIENISLTIKELVTLGLLKFASTQSPQNIDEASSYEFSHFTFQEYYAAGHVLSDVTQHSGNLLRDLTQIKLNPRYQLILWFIAGSLKNAKQFDGLMRALTAPEGSDLLGNYQLSLLIGFIKENWLLAQQTGWAKMVTNQIQTRILQLWQQYQRDIPKGTGTYSKEWYDKQPELTHYLYIPPSWVNQLKIAGPTYKLQDNDLDLFHEIKLGLFMSNSDKVIFARFIGWLGVVSPKVISHLTWLLADQYENAQNHAIRAIIKLNDPMIATPAILDQLFTLLSSHYTFSTSPAEAIGCLCAESVMPAYLERLLSAAMSDDSSRRWSTWKRTYIIKDPQSAALNAIEKLGPTAASPAFLEKLLEFLQNKDPEVQCNALRIVKRLSTCAAIPPILEKLFAFLESTNDEIRPLATRIVGELAHHTSKPIFFEKLPPLLNDKDDFVCTIAAEAIEELGIPAATPAILTSLLNLLKRKDKKVKICAAKTIARLALTTNHPLFIEQFFVILNDPELYLAALKAIKLDEDDANFSLNIAFTSQEFLEKLPLSLPNINSEFKHFGLLIISLHFDLFKLASSPVAPVLLQKILAVLDELAEIDREIISIPFLIIAKLGELAATDIVLNKLSSLLTHENINICSAAAAALGYIAVTTANTMFLEKFITLLCNEKVYIRNGAAKTMIDCTEKTLHIVLEKLPDLLTDNDYEVRTTAAQIVENLDANAATPAILEIIPRLLTDSQGSVRAAAAQTIEHLHKAMVSAVVFEKILPLLADEYRNARYSARAALSHLTQHYLSQHKEFTGNTSFAFLTSLIIGCYSSDAASFSIYWDAEENRYSWQGFIGKESFNIQLTLDQARWIRHHTRVIIRSLNEDRWQQQGPKIMQMGMTGLPAQNIDPMLFEYNQQNHSSSSTTFSLWRSTSKIPDSASYGLGADAIISLPLQRSNTSETGCVMM